MLIFLSASLTTNFVELSGRYSIFSPKNVKQINNKVNMKIILNKHLIARVLCFPFHERKKINDQRNDYIDQSLIQCSLSFPLSPSTEAIAWISVRSPFVRE